MQFFPHPKRSICKRLAAATALFLCAFFAGGVVAHAISNLKITSKTDRQVLDSPTDNTGSRLTASSSSHLSPAYENWGLSFQQEGKPPVANATSDYLKQFQAHYIADTNDSVIYLTFDAGYENGNTAVILDALKKHNAPAAFFLVGNYLETSP